MEIAVAAVIITLVFVLSLLSLLFSKKRATPVLEARVERPARPVVRGRRAVRRRRRIQSNAISSSDEDSPPTDEEDDGMIPEEQEIGSTRQQRLNAYEERRRQRDAEREAKEEAEAAELLRKAEARRQQEEEEAAKWAEFITVEEKGEIEENDEQDLMKQFVDTIKSRKIVVLEELAAEFEIRTQEVIQRIQELETQKRLTGVMDDRGKYLFIPLNEMEKVREYIESRGRVSISELASVTHRFIDLDCH